MDGFKKLPKQIACFKEGGSIQRQVENFTKRDRKTVESDDIAQDKSLIKKAFKQHDEAEHDKEPTEIKLRKGGRAKKETGTVKKFKVGGAVGVYGAKKASGDLDSIEKAKKVTPAKAAAPSGAKKTPNKYKKGGAIKKMADGGILDTLKNNIMGTPAQNEIARQNEAKYLRAKQLQRAAGSQMGPAEQMATGLASAGQQLQPAAPAAVPAQKKGGKVKKLNTGGTCS